MKLLIVDDDIYTREGLAETIPWNLYGIDDVMQAENGKEALHTVSWYLPDLIITDIRMPQKNGIDFCREAIQDHFYYRLHADGVSERCDRFVCGGIY